MTTIPAPYPYFTDASGNALEAGKIYIGTAGLDPRTNPIAVYQDEALTIAWAQPIRTVGGYPVYIGAPSNIQTAALEFSLIVASSTGEVVFRDLNVVSIDAANVRFIQSGTGAVARAAQAKLRDVVSVKDFGAVGNNTADDTAAIQLAIAAAIAGLKALYFPAGTYKISSDLTIAAPIFLHGDGATATIIRQTGASANGILFDYPSLVQGGGIDGISIEAGAGWLTSGFQGSGSTGIGLRLTNSNGRFFASNFAVSNFDTGVSVRGSFYPQFKSFEILYSTVTGVDLAKSGAVVGAGSLWADGKVSNFGFTGVNTSSYGIKINASGGDFFKSIDVTTFNKGISLISTATENVLYCFFSDMLADTCLTNNWEFDATLGKIWSINMANCWGAFSTNGEGVIFKGAGIDSVKWVGGAVRENGTHGVRIQGGTNVKFVGTEIASNSVKTANTSNGVYVDAGVSHWALIGCRIGNIASGFTGQAENIYIAAGASAFFQVVNCNLVFPGAGKSPIANGSSSSNFTLSGNLPQQSAGINASGRITLAGGSAAASPAAGATVYLGLAGSSASVAFNPFTVGLPGVVTGFYASVSAAPGAAQTYTYTVFLNGSATSMTGTISGAASFSVSVNTNAFLVNTNDLITLRLVTSAGAAVSIHNFGIFVEP